MHDRYLIGEDFSFEQRNIMFQPNQDTLIIPFEFFENMAPELTENLRISITATIQSTSGNAIDVPIQPPTIVVSILDNDCKSNRRKVYYRT